MILKVRMKFRRLGSNLYITIFFFKKLACFQSYGEHCKYPCSLQCYNNICDKFNRQCLKMDFMANCVLQVILFSVLHILINYFALMLCVKIP